MPIFKAGPQLVFYAHVPKCGGSAVSWYMTERFGAVAFHDNRFTARPLAQRWSRTSPQHVDVATLERLFPPGFFDVVFTIVRHPVARVVSAFHFQRDVESSISQQVGFHDWLLDIEERRAEDPFVFDNHVRPMVEMVPEGAHVFHMEHGLDALVPWFDEISGAATGPRAVPRINEQGQYEASRSEKVRPTDADLELIQHIYGADFDRFGYRLDSPAPLSDAPELSDRVLAERDAMLRDFNSPIGKLKRRLGARLGRGGSSSG